MKILYVASAFPPASRGGTELHAFDIARGMQGKGHDVRVLTRSGDPERDDYETSRDQHEGLDVIRINYNFGDAASFEWIYLNPRIDDIVSDVLRDFTPDLVHIHHLTCLSTGIIDRVKDVGVALVMTLHDFWMVCPRGQRIDPNLEICETVDRVKCQACLSGLWPHFFPGVEALSTTPPTAPRSAEGAPEELARWDRQIKRVLERCDLLLAPSAFHRDRLLEFDLAEELIEALPHGLDHERFDSEREPSAPVRRIGFIGSVIPSKGVHVLVDAFVALEIEGFELSIWGEAPIFHGDSGYVERMRTGIPDGTDVRFRGAYDRRDLPLILRDIDVLVVPSLWWESFCLTIREGLLAGCIVVAANHGPMAEALGEGRDGMLFEPGSVADLKAKLAKVASDPRLAARLRNRGSSVKTLDVNLRETEDVYRRALGRAGLDPELAQVGPLLALEQPADSVSARKDGVTVFIPTYNGGPLFEKVLEQVLAQETEFEFEVLVIDSGSSDETLDIIARHPVRLIEIPNSEFNHGLTRNRAVREARGDIVALLTQDAVPYDETWLATLVANFDDPEVAGAYCHQLPRDDCNPFQKDRLDGWTKGEGDRVVKQIASRAEYEALPPMEKYRIIGFDDVASCVRKSVMQKIPFERRQFGEDVAWARQAIFAGYRVVMDPHAVVVHSHNNSIWYEFKRVYLDHQNLHDLVGMHLVTRIRDVCRFTLDGTRHLGGVIRRSEISRFKKIAWWVKVPFYSLGQNLGQYLGARSLIEGKRGVWGAIDRFLKKGV